MNNTVLLQKLDRSSIESSATSFSITIWLSLWLAIGTISKIWLDTWYGFGAGFIIAPVVSIFLMWLLFARTSKKEELIVSASWKDSIFSLTDPVDDEQISIDLSKTHKAILIRAKAERQFFLRLEQKNSDNSKTRIDIIGPMPIVRPMLPDGDAPSLIGFFSMAPKGGLKTSPYKIKNIEGSHVATSDLLSFVEHHKENRKNITIVHRQNQNIKIENGQLTLLTETGEISFNDPSTLTLKTMASTRDAQTENPQEDSVKTAHVLWALIPPEGEEHALVFATIAPIDWEAELPSKWTIPDEAVKNRFTLYDDSITSYIVTRILKNSIKAIEPNSPALDLLRH